MNINFFSLREQEIFKTLYELNTCQFVVIGGYAVNDYTLPRFSVDCDLVISNSKELLKIETLLLQRDYKKVLLPKNLSYLGQFNRYEKKLDTNFSVSIDILIGQVTDRMTNSIFTFDWIFRNSNLRLLKGKTITQELKVRIVNLDALLVMKIIAGRSTDIRDVFMMFPHAQNLNWINSEISSRYNSKDRFDKIKIKISSKQFKDDLSGVFGFIELRVFEKYKEAILKFNPLTK